MLTLLFRIQRKVLLKYKILGKKYFLLKMKSLYTSRLIISSDMVYGKLFSIHFDLSSSSIEIGQQVQFRNCCHIQSGLDGKLKIGNKVFFNNGCTINCFAEISIGDNCQFGEDVKFYDMNHKYNDLSILIADQGYVVGSIKVGSNCWFGSNVTILKDVIVGDNVVIGANCLIYKSIPSNSVVIQKQDLIITPIN
jgi:acetyltransferase-like isoleucine patch superfamily enzyme